MNAPRSIHNLVLAGFMGTGKTTVGRGVAEELGFNFVDTDHLIEEMADCTISDLFAQAGEPFFRELERKVVLDLASYRQTVIATGGGMTANEANMTSLKQHALVVCLWASPEAIFDRVRRQTHRPLLHGPDPLQKIRRLLEAREPFYRLADVLVRTEQRSAREVVQHVLHEFNLARHQALAT